MDSESLPSKGRSVIPLSRRGPGDSNGALRVRGVWQTALATRAADPAHATPERLPARSASPRSERYNLPPWQMDGNFHARPSEGDAEAHCRPRKAHQAGKCGRSGCSDDVASRQHPTENHAALTWCRRRKALFENDLTHARRILVTVAVPQQMDGLPHRMARLWTPVQMGTRRIILSRRTAAEGQTPTVITTSNPQRRCPNDSGDSVPGTVSILSPGGSPTLDPAVGRTGRATRGLVPRCPDRLARVLSHAQTMVAKDAYHKPHRKAHPKTPRAASTHGSLRQRPRRPTSRLRTTAPMAPAARTYTHTLTVPRPGEIWPERCVPGIISVHAAEACG